MKLWDEETGFYYDLRKDGRHNMVRHIGAFWALLAQCAPKDRAGRLKGNPARADFVGWTGLTPISVLFEYVFGIKPHADKKKILWCVDLLDRHGIHI